MNVGFEFAYDGASSSFADVLFTEVSGGFSFSNWRFYIRENKVLVELLLTCRPFWRGDQVTIRPLYYNKSPAIITPGDIQGDVETPAVLELSSSGTKAFGS